MFMAEVSWKISDDRGCDIGEDTEREAADTAMREDLEEE